MLILFSFLSAYTAVSLCLIQATSKIVTRRSIPLSRLQIGLAASALFVWSMFEYTNEWGAERGIPPFLCLYLAAGPLMLFAEYRLNKYWLKSVAVAASGAIISGLTVSLGGL